MKNIRVGQGIGVTVKCQGLLFHPPINKHQICYCRFIQMHELEHGQEQTPLQQVRSSGQIRVLDPLVQESPYCKLKTIHIFGKYFYSTHLVMQYQGSQQSRPALIFEAVLQLVPCVMVIFLNPEL